MVKCGLIMLALFAFVALPTLIDAGGVCSISERCPDVTETPGETPAYCKALKTQTECLSALSKDADCVGELATISSKIAADAKNYNKYKCGAAGLVGSTIMCLIVFVMSMVVKT